jgi:hypothetical protein
MNIESFRELLREQGLDLEVHGIACLPRELKKYIGSISKYQKKGGGFSYVVHILHKDFKLSKSFKTEAKAEQYLHETNVREGLPIKNRFTIYEDRVLVELHGD